MFLKNRKKKYNYRYLGRIYNLIQNESSVVKKRVFTLHFAFEFLTDIHSLNFFKTEKEVRQAKWLTLVILSWTFNSSQVLNILQFLVKFLFIYKNYLDSTNEDNKKFKIWKKQIILSLAAIWFTVMVFYHLISDLPKQETQFQFWSTSPLIEKVEYLNLKSSDTNQRSFLVFQGFNKAKRKNFGDENIQNPMLYKGKRLSVHNFDHRKRPKVHRKTIPLSQRTGTLDKLQKRTQDKLIQKIKTTVPYKIIMKPRLAQDIANASNYLEKKEKDNFQLKLMGKFMETKSVFIITTKKCNYKLVKSYYPDFHYQHYSYWKNKIFRVQFILSDPYFQYYKVMRRAECQIDVKASNTIFQLTKTVSNLE